jgi:hypothetical protein
MSKLEELIAERDRLQEEVTATQARLDVTEDALLEERFRGWERFQEGDIILVPRKLFGKRTMWPARIYRVRLNYTEGINPDTAIFGDEAGQPWSHQEIWYTVFLKQKDGTFGGTSTSVDHREVQPAPAQEKTDV